MSIFAGINENATDVKQETDTLGGNRILDSGVYEMEIKAAYSTVAKSGAKGLAIQLESEAGNHRETLYVTSGTKKGGLPYTERNGEKSWLPGYLLADGLCLLTVGKSITELPAEKRVIKLYSFEEKKEVMTEVDMLVDLLGQKIKVGLLKQTENKKQKVGDEYVPTAEIKELNVVDKFFRADDGKTVAELRAGSEDAAFIVDWTAKWEGQVKDRTTKVDASTVPQQASGSLLQAATQQAAPTASAESSIFART